MLKCHYDHDLSPYASPLFKFVSMCDWTKYSRREIKLLRYIYDCWMGQNNLRSQIKSQLLIILEQVKDIGPLYYQSIHVKEQLKGKDDSAIHRQS